MFHSQRLACQLSLGARAVSLWVLRAGGGGAAPWAWRGPGVGLAWAGEAASSAQGRGDASFLPLTAVWAAGVDGGRAGRREDRSWPVINTRAAADRARLRAWPRKREPLWHRVSSRHSAYF